MLIQHLKSQKYLGCLVMTKKLAQNVIAEYWSKNICKIMVKWPKKQDFAYSFFSKQYRANLPFRADINMVLLIIFI